MVKAFLQHLEINIYPSLFIRLQNQFIINAPLTLCDGAYLFVNYDFHS